MKVSKKMLAGSGLALFAGSGAVFAAVLIASLTANATVNEAFSTAETAVSWTGFPSEQICDTIDVTNSASNPINALFSFAETSNPNAVVYTDDMPKTVSLSPGANSVDVCIDITNDSPAGSVDGTVTIERVA